MTGTIEPQNEPAPQSLRQLLEKYGDSLWPEGSHKRNVYSFILQADEIVFGRQFSSFGSADLREIQEAFRSKGNTEATINRKTMALSKLLRHAWKSGDLASITDFDRQEEPEERIRFLTRHEERSLFARIAAISSEYEMLSVVLVDTGATIGEVIDLKWPEVRIDEGTVCFSKGVEHSERTIPLTSRAKRILASIDHSSEGPFSTVEQYKYRAAWNEAKQTAGFGDEEGIVPYILRHTCASRLVMGGVDLRRVQLWLGHRTLRITLKYDYLSTNDLGIGVAVLEKGE
ncbi:MAG: site-specific integrase [Mesorhizobium sp.]